jgi:plastocyanin
MSAVSLGVLALTLVACDQPASPTAAGARTPGLAVAATVSVRFGINERGSPFPQQNRHDQSSTAADRLVPQTVVITRGGSVTFQIDEVHQAAVYRPGMLPGDIRIDRSTLASADLGFGIVLPEFRINDPNGRLARAPSQALVDHTWTTPPGTFEEPGRYLVICTSAPHFVLNRMYGWVIVQ